MRMNMLGGKYDPLPYPSDDMSEFRKMVLENIAEGSYILDIGCKSGEWARSNKKYLKSNIKIVGFDPIEYDHEEGLYFKYFDFALGETDTNYKFNIFEESGCNSIYLPTEELLSHRKMTNNITVPMRRLDSIIPKLLQLNSIAYLKTDCQGSDLGVIKGAGKLINTIDYIEMEAILDPDHNFYKGCPTVLDVIEYMESVNFELVEFFKYPHSPLPEGEVLFRRNGI